MYFAGYWGCVTVKWCNLLYSPDYSSCSNITHLINIATLLKIVFVYENFPIGWKIDIGVWSQNVLFSDCVAWSWLLWSYFEEIWWYRDVHHASWHSLKILRCYFKAISSQLMLHMQSEESTDCLSFIWMLPPPSWWMGSSGVWINPVTPKKENPSSHGNQHHGRVPFLGCTWDHQWAVWQVRA